MANLIQSLLTPVAQHVKAQFTRKARQPAAVQEQFLLSLLAAHQNTVLGQQFQLNQIRTVDEFRSRISILPYSSYQPYIERAARGEPNILTPDPVVYFNQTSGSTGKQKLIPVTRRSRQARSRASRTGIGFAIDAACRWERPVGKMLLTTPIQLLGRTCAGIEYGYVSAVDLRSNHFLSRLLVACPLEALQLTESLARHYVCLLFALRNPHIGVIGANFPVLALQLSHYLEAYAEDLIGDLATGAIAPWIKIEPEVRTRLEQQFSAAPRRAEQLRQILKTEGRLTPERAWPHLSFIVTARGGTSDFYLERFPEYFGDTPIFGGLYAASEAVFGIYPDFNTDGTVLAIESGFFEFIPQDQWHVDRPSTRLAEAVRIGEQYRILVTNYNGLYRYDIGDVVEVVGFYEQTPLITFRYRQGGLLSAINEKTTEFHVTQVMRHLQQQFDLALENFCITLSEQETPPRYLVNIELAPGSLLPHPQAFLAQFDCRLQAIQASYEAKRQSQHIPPPQLQILKPGSFAMVRQRLLARGIPESQLKFPHISEDRRFLADLTVEKSVAHPSEDNECRGLCTGKTQNGV